MEIEWDSDTGATNAKKPPARALARNRRPLRPPDIHLPVFYHPVPQGKEAEVEPVRSNVLRDLILLSALVALLVTVAAFAIRANFDPAAIEAADPTDQIDRAIAGLSLIERPEPPILVRYPVATGVAAALLTFVVGGVAVAVNRN